jgi:hypothetical protein
MFKKINSIILKLIYLEKEYVNERLFRGHFVARFHANRVYHKVLHGRILFPSEVFGLTLVDD